ncbi:MAG: hypothetical protein ABI828_01325 [Actinomycetota bacterium]
MTFGRRPLFFLAVSAISVLLLAPTPLEFWWLNIAMAGLAFFWFVMLAVEEGQTNGASPPDEARSDEQVKPVEREEQP